MCNQTNYLLKGDAAQSLADFLCTNLNDTQLEELFVLISSQLNITKAKQIVIEALQDDITLYFFDNLVKLSSAFRTLNSRFANMLPLNGFRSLQSVYNEITNIDLEKTICQGSQLSIFTILKSIRIVVPKGVKGMVDQLEPGLKSIDQILKKFVRFDTKGLNLNVKIPEYYRTAKTAYDERKTQVYFVFILVLFVFD